MKSTFKLLGIIAFVAMIGLSFASCGDAGDSGGTVTNDKAVYTSVDAEGNKYELTITSKSDKAAYEPKEGDTYTLKIFFVDGTTKTSVGTVTHEVKNGSTVTATLSVSYASFTVTLSTVTDGLSVMTEIKGTIPITDDDNKPTIEIELTLTPQVETGSTAVIGVILNKTALDLDVGGSETLVATVLPTNAANKNVTWSSSKPAVAQVSQSGEVSALAAGSATITVTTVDGNKPAICNVMVTEVDEIQVPVVSDFVISGIGTFTADGTPKSVTILSRPGKTSGAITVFYNESDTAPSEAGTYLITFNVAASPGWKPVTGLFAGILVITEDGGEVLTPVLSDFIITGLTQIHTGSPCSVTVIPKAGKSPGLITVYYNGSATAPSAAGSYAITFDVAAAQGWNSASGLDAGTLVISASSISVIRVSLDITALEIGTGDIEYLTAIIEPANATNQNVTWKSSNDDVATVSQLGAVTGIFPGSATITVTTEDGSKTATCVVTVYLTPAGLAAYLAKLPANNASLPHNIPLRVRQEGESYLICGVLQEAPNKYVNLDLTGSTITSIPYSSFNIGSSSNEGNLTTLCGITIPKSVTSIGYWAFGLCTSLVSVTFEEPSSLTSIGRYAFYHCTSLASINIPDSVTSIGEVAFQGCTSLASVTIPSNVTSIEFSAFYMCSSLASVSIPNNVTSIGVFAFSECTNLASVTFAPTSKVTSIGVGAFQGCSSLASVEIPNSVTSIENQAFMYCTSLATVTFAEPCKVTSIENRTFEQCTSLANINIPNSVTSIEDNAFRSSSLTSINIPNSVKTIGELAFCECTSLASVTIGNNVTSIGEWAFWKCTSLAIVTFVATSKVTSIEEWTFGYCESLVIVNIPNSVTSIDDYAFGGCSSLSSITIPGNVKNVGNGILVWCYNLSSVTFLGTIPSSGVDEAAFATLGDLHVKFYATDHVNGTPGIYTSARIDGNFYWTLQQ
jgi:uncharacterized protein YjdB